MNKRIHTVPSHLRQLVTTYLAGMMRYTPLGRSALEIVSETDGTLGVIHAGTPIMLDLSNLSSGIGLDAGVSRAIVMEVLRQYIGGNDHRHILVIDPYARPEDEYVSLRQAFTEVVFVETSVCSVVRAGLESSIEYAMQRLFASHTTTLCVELMRPLSADETVDSLGAMLISLDVVLCSAFDGEGCVVWERTASNLVWSRPA